jgi:predicted nuclease with TOPRIM domain
MADGKKESLKLQQQEFKDSLEKNKANTLEKIKELKGTSPQVQEAAKRLADSFARLTNQVNNLAPKGGGGAEVGACFQTPKKHRVSVR